MALVSCNGCGNEVNARAESCPRCGAKVVKRPLGCGSILIAVLVILGIAGWLWYR